MSEKFNLKFSLLIFVTFSLLFLLVHPKVSTLLFPQKRQYILNDFLNETKKNNKIDPQQYWEFREFYSPGYFNFGKKGLDTKLVDKALTELGVSIDKQYLYFAFLKYNSVHLNSLDLLVMTDDLNKAVKFSEGEKIFSAKNQIMYRDGENLKIIFLMDMKNMRRANGFFEYKNEDSYLVEKDPHWLNITSIKE